MDGPNLSSLPGRVRYVCLLSPLAFHDPNPGFDSTRFLYLRRRSVKYDLPALLGIGVE